MQDFRLGPRRIVYRVDEETDEVHEHFLALDPRGSDLLAMSGSPAGAKSIR